MEVQQLEKSELQMVQNLKNTQQIQSKTLKEFEDILMQARNTSPCQKLNVNKSIMSYYSPSSPLRNTAKGIRKNHYHSLNNSVLVERLHQAQNADQAERGSSQNSKNLNLQITAFSYNPSGEAQTPNSSRKIIDAMRGQGNHSRKSSRQNSLNNEVILDCIKNE